MIHRLLLNVIIGSHAFTHLQMEQLDQLYIKGHRQATKDPKTEGLKLIKKQFCNKWRPQKIRLVTNNIHQHHQDQMIQFGQTLTTEVKNFAHAKQLMESRTERTDKNITNAVDKQIRI